MYRFQHHAQLFTVTNLNWLHIFRAVVGRLTNKNGAQSFSKNKNSYFEACIVFNITPNFSPLPILTKLYIFENDYQAQKKPQLM